MWYKGASRKHPYIHGTMRRNKIGGHRAQQENVHKYGPKEDHGEKDVGWMVDAWERFMSMGEETLRDNKHSEYTEMK